ELDCAVTVRVNALIADGLETRTLRRPRELVVEQRTRRVERAAQELDAVLLRNDRRTFGHEHRKSGRMVAMGMRDHHVADRLVRELPFDLRDVRSGARLALAGLEHHDVLVELDDDRVVATRARGVAPNAVAEL